MAQKMKRFGWPTTKAGPKPQDWSTLYKSYLENKYYIFNVKKVEFDFPKKGAFAGSRKFHQFLIPPLRFWNVDIRFQENKRYSLEPTLSVELESGKKHVIKIATDMHAFDILRKLKEIGGPKLQ